MRKTLKKIFRPVYHSYLRIRYHGRTLDILKKYKNHYEEAQKLYGLRPFSSPDQVLIRKWHPSYPHNDIQFPPQYSTLIENIRKDVQTRFSESNNCRFFPPIDTSYVPIRTEEIEAVKNQRLIALQLKPYLDIHSAEDLCQAIFPQIERFFFGSYVIADKVYVYRNLSSQAEDQVSWRWHYDNHPVGILKIMVYLTDVTEQNGPLEYLCHHHTGQPRYMNPEPLLGVNISPQKLKKYKEEGFISHKVTGARGTMLLFDENVLHKANRAQKGFRDVIVFQIRPATFKPKRYIAPQWTGSFEHMDFNLDPWDYEPKLKKKMHSTY